MNSLRTRFIFGFSLLLLPLIILAGVGYFYFQQSIAAFHLSISQVVENVIPLNKLQQRIQLVRLNELPSHSDNIKVTPLQEEISNIQQQLLSTASASPKDGDYFDLYQSSLEEWRYAQQTISRYLSDPKSGMTDQAILDSYTDHLLNTLYLLNKIEYKQQQKAAQYYSEAERIRIQIQILIGSVFIIGLLVALTISIHLARSILLPLSKLGAWAQAFAENKQPESINMQSYTEFEQLAITFNTLTSTLQDQQNMLDKLSLRDELTGLHNKRSFELRLHEEFIRFERYEHRLALMIVDIDHFKTINNNYDRKAGDHVLIETARLLQTQIRPIDHLARYNSAEFALLLPEIDHQGAHALAERIRTTISDTSFPLEQHNIGITVSVGYALLGENAKTLEQLFSLANNAVLKAQNSGKNQTCYLP